MELRTMLAFSDNANALVRKTIEQSPEAWQTEFQTISIYNSIQKLAAHCIGAEERWVVKGVYEEPVNGRYEDLAAKDIPGLFEDWASLRERTRAALDMDLSVARKYPMPHWGVEPIMTRTEMIFQVLSHETFHRGQISMALQQMQIDPPNFDYPFLRPTP